MPHHFAVYQLPHPHVAYGLRSAGVFQNRMFESIEWAFKDGDEQVGNGWVIEEIS